MARLGARLKHAWNAFTGQENVSRSYGDYSAGSYSSRPDRTRIRISNERSIISSIYNRISIDVASVEIRHARLDDSNSYIGDVDSGLNNCLTIEANIDQAARHFRQDIVMSLFDEGCIAIVPVDTTLNPNLSGSFDIKTLRVGKICRWMPNQVTVDLYNETLGRREEITLSKKFVAIIENPLYSVMNEPSSTLQRLIRKLGMLDDNDAATSSGKLDLIIQLPYVIKSDAKREQAEQRRKDIEFQLKGSTYGIAYTDGTEKITQLNRPAENQLLDQIKWWTKELYGQLGLTEEIMNGTADEKAMINYINRTIEPILDAIVEAMRRSFLTKTARSQKQTILYFRDPFKLIPIGDIAEIADKFTRNEIMSSNEFRQVIGMKPSKDPKANQLINSNMPQPDPGVSSDAINSSFDDINKTLDDVFNDLGSDANA